MSGLATQVDATSWRIAVVCSGSTQAGEYVVIDGCPTDVPMCAQPVPSAIDSAVMAWSVVGAWAAIWGIKLLWQSRSMSSVG